MAKYNIDSLQKAHNQEITMLFFCMVITVNESLNEFIINLIIDNNNDNCQNEVLPFLHHVIEIEMKILTWKLN